MFATPVHAQIRGWEEAGCLSDGVPTLKCLEVVAGNLLFISSALVVLVLFIMFLVGSATYILSAGNPERVKKAQSTLKFAVIGFVIFLLSFLILTTIDTLFLGGEGKLLRFEIP